MVVQNDARNVAYAGLHEMSISSKGVHLKKHIRPTYTSYISSYNAKDRTNYILTCNGLPSIFVFIYLYWFVSFHNCLYLVVLVKQFYEMFCLVILIHWDMSLLHLGYYISFRLPLVVTTAQLAFESFTHSIQCYVVDTYCVWTNGIFAEMN